MLRITRITGSEMTETLRLEGKLLEPWVAEVRSACEQLPARPGELRLDLSGVSFVDNAGVTLLRTLVRQGIALVGCSGFVAELLHVGEP